MHKELIERLRAGSGGMKHWQELESEAADAIEELQATATEYQQAADKMAWEHKVERDALRQHIKHIGNDALRSENHELRQQLAEARAVWAVPSCPYCKAPDLLYECIHCSASNYPAVPKGAV